MLSTKKRMDLLFGYADDFNYLPFEEARKFVRELGLKSEKDWKKYCKLGNKPDDIPICSDTVYKDVWISWKNWLGNEYRSFKESKKFVMKLKLKSYEQWNEYCKSEKKPEDIPSRPDDIYKNDGWVSWGDWMDNGNISYRTIKWECFCEARKFVRKLGLKSQMEWQKYCRSKNKPVNIPSRANVVYKNKGWISWNDWLNKHPYGNQVNFRPFEESRRFVRNLKFKNTKGWKEYCKSGKRPENIPSNPNSAYKNKGWTSMGDWLGTGYVSCRKRQYKPFKVARSFVRKLGLKNFKQWNKYYKSDKKPKHIPSCPHNVYRDEGWISLGDWLGTGYVSCRKRNQKKFKQARSFVRKLKLKKTTEWQEYCKSGKRPENIPSNPQQTYKNKGWISLKDWIGK